MPRMKMHPDRTKDYYKKEYVENKRSPADIAKEWGTYTNKIRRELIRYGFRVRNRSKAQKWALKSGRHKHPTEGTHRSEHTKEILSKSLYQLWVSSTDEEKKERSERAREQWQKMTPEEREVFSRLAGDAIRQASKDGSKLELYLKSELTKAGFAVEFHRDLLIPNEQLQADIYIPEMSLVIEVDGPSHFAEVWGEERLRKTQQSDHKKNTLLTAYGFTVIRLQNKVQSMSSANMRRAFNLLLAKLRELKEMGAVPIEKRLVFLELRKNDAEYT